MEDPAVDFQEIERYMLPQTEDGFALTPKDELLQTSIKDLLRPDRNILAYRIDDGKTVHQLRCSLYLWEHTDKVVASDIDGTVTISDALGQLLPRLGPYHWAQPNVTKLFRAIHD